MRKKLLEKKKKDKFTITIDENISNLLDGFLDDNKISNKSKYIERLIRIDMESKGENIEREF